MSDTERDAWLREALRHAPDANAAPPSDVSETILAQARAAARQGRAAGAAPRRHPVAALWDWLARPPVAAGFASVMAATLVGLMWWDRPMDEGVPRGRSVALDRAQASAAAVAPSAPAAPIAAAPDSGATAERAVADTRGAADARRSDASRDADAAGRVARRVDGAATRDETRAKVLQPPQVAMQRPAPAAPPPEASTKAAANAQLADAKEQSRKLEASAALGDERAAAKPQPFPRGDDERAAFQQAAPEKKKDAANDRGSSGGATAPADALAARDAPLAKSAPATAPPPPAAAAPAEAERVEAPAAAARQRANEPARTTPTLSADAAKRTPAATMPAAPTPAPATMPGLRGSATGDVREKQASAFGAPPAADARNEVAQTQREGAAPAPLAPILAAIAGDPARWSRATASGSVVALDGGWRDWLAQLDAAARGRWQPASDSGERDGTTTLRLVAGGRTVAIVRLDGTLARLDALERGERWQATLPAAAAERLRAAAGPLGR